MFVIMLLALLLPAGAHAAEQSTMNAKANAQIAATKRDQAARAAELAQERATRDAATAERNAQ